MISTYRNISVTISGDSDEDIRQQAKEHFGFQDVKVRKPAYCETGKVDLIKFLRDFERRFYGRYNNETGECDLVNSSLIDLKRFVEERFGA